LQTYEYPAVTMLAERVGVHGLRRTEMASPSDNKTKALQFAGFLAHLHTFYEDACIQEWISFLDDFLGEDDEQNRLWNFLCGSSPDEPTRFGILVEGALSFVESMSDAFGVLDKKEFAQYGMPHAYWLQKFFGYVLTEKGYERDPAYEKDASWANLLVSSVRIAPQGTVVQASPEIWQKFAANVKLLERVFEAIQQTVAKSRKTVLAEKERTERYLSSHEQPRDVRRPRSQGITEVVEAVSQATGNSKSETGEIIKAIMNAIKSAVSKGDGVQLIGFGSFAQGSRAARMGRNPKTGRVPKLQSTRYVKFVVGRAFKDSLREKE
jgi:DNA-binding protein HU-beta